jgi:hypothetical protein
MDGLRELAEASIASNAGRLAQVCERLSAPDRAPAHR